jgi:hypothetical protein
MAKVLLESIHCGSAAAWRPCKGPKPDQQVKLECSLGRKLKGANSCGVRGAISDKLVELGQHDALNPIIAQVGVEDLDNAGGFRANGAHTTKDVSG